MTDERGLRVVKVPASLVMGLMKFGSDGFWPGVDVPDDLQLIEARLARHTDDHTVLLFVSSAVFNEPEDLKAMHGDPRVPEWRPHFARKVIS
jgi:hypothetical protein